MKNTFPGHFPKPDTHHKNLWTECLFVFDANILLNLYRYSDEARTTFLNILEKLKDRIWIPYRVAEEYLDNRLKVINEQQEHYGKTISEINKLEARLENKRQHPFVSKEIMALVGESLSKLKEELEKNKEPHSKRFTDDDIKESIASLFDERVGVEAEDEQLEEIIKDGKRRYDERIPPGYSDAKKTSDDESLKSRCRPYGDLILWKQLIDKSKTEERPIIFITDDEKEDWWLTFNGRTISPRPELVKEFELATGKDFHMYNPERFISLADEFLTQNTPQEILAEIRENRAPEELKQHPIIKRDLRLLKGLRREQARKTRDNRHELIERVVFLRNQLAQSQKLLDSLHEQRESLTKLDSNIHSSISLSEEEAHERHISLQASIEETCYQIRALEDACNYMMHEVMTLDARIYKESIEARSGSDEDN